MCRTVLVVLATVVATVPASAGELDQGVLSAERTLRAAELRRSIDSTALSLYHQASKQAEAALGRNPDSAGANFVYFAATGRILIADGATKNLFTLRNLDKQYLDKAIRLDPGYANALAAKGGVLLELPSMLGGDSEEGLRLLRRATELNPGGPGTRISLARALAEDGKVEEARKEARRAAHLSCIQGRYKSLEEASALLDELEAPVAKAGLR
jgi:tetratricopeptide (TPR) repeat protein